MEVGVVGLPNVGKSTIFNAATRAGAEVASYPFTTISSNVGVAEVPDERLRKIAEVIKPQRVVPATVKFVDIAGLVRGASRGEGLGNQFLSYIRTVDAIAHVLRCFTDENVAHPHGDVDPVADAETVNVELALADLATIEGMAEKAGRQTKSGDAVARHRLDVLKMVKEGLERGTPIRFMELSPDDREIFKGIGVLTDKPVIYVANVDEEEAARGDSRCAASIRELAERERAGHVVISAKVEAEMAELEDEEAAEFRQDLGLAESGLTELIKACYDLLGLITFFTIESNECRAWPVPRGIKAPQAAGRIHTDMERGFIKAEVVNWEHLVEAGSFHAAREKGHFLVEGREYVVKDGDVVLFKFAV